MIYPVNYDIRVKTFKLLRLLWYLWFFSSFWAKVRFVKFAFICIWWMHFYAMLFNLPDGTSNFFFQISLKMKKKCFACVRLSLEAGWSLISLWRIYDHVMKFDQSESPSSQQGIDAPCNYQRGKREENDGGGGAWSARYSLDIHYTVQKSFDFTILDNRDNSFY